MPAPRKYPNELRERAQRPVARAEDPSLSLNAAVKRIGPRVGMVPDTLPGGVRSFLRCPAEATALAALRHSDLPVAELDGPSREVKLIVDHRRVLVAARTRAQNRLRWHLHELDPPCRSPAVAVPLPGRRRARRAAYRLRRRGGATGPRARRAVSSAGDTGPVTGW